MPKKPKLLIFVIAYYVVTFFVQKQWKSESR